MGRGERAETSTEGGGGMSYAPFVPPLFIDFVFSVGVLRWELIILEEF